ncbi:hypothetical protein ACET3Z_029049 [Daucus carota]
MLYRVTSSTTLCCVKISDGPKSLLGFGFDKKVNNPLGHFLGTRPYSVHVLDKYMYQPLIKCLGCVTFFTGRFETVPFTKERLYVFPFVDKIWGEWYFRSVKEAFKTGFVLPQSDPQCIRVESIAIKILEALQRETCRRHKLADRKWLKGDDGEYKVVRERREENVKVTSAYLDEGIDWEFFVPDTPTVNAAYINIGKILVFRGFFDLYKTDEELAIAIATEVAHVVCRHAQRRLTWLPFKLYHRFMNNFNPIIYHQLRHEHEGDFIGMLLSASAGYDPRVAPMALAKMKREDVCMLFEDQRIAYMARPEVMQQAVTIYEAKKKEQGFTSHYTTLHSVKTSNGSKRLLGLCFNQELHNPLSHFVGTRHYSVDRFQDYVYRPVMKCLSFVTFLIGRFEVVPFTKKIVYVFPFVDKIWGEVYYARHEQEADIAMLSSASAGYDPRVVLLALRKMRRDLRRLDGSKIPLLHLEKRIEYASTPEVMQKAVSVYQEIKKRQCTDRESLVEK